MSSLSRRHFLEQTMFTTAAALALEAQRAQANEPQQQQPPSIGPNDTIQVAVVGAGGRGQSHIDGFAGRPGSVGTHICDCDEKAGQRSCEKAAEKQGGKKPVWVKDVRKLLEDKSINAVSIATPNH
ncbi:MAG: Gfo/Idh/MocA family oxidoreductase, partial [Pirellula sp.]